MKAKEKQLLEYLQRYCPGRENAISGKQLKKRFRVHEAELRKLVHNLRVDGAPICSDRTGYFYPANSGEVYTTILQLQRMELGLRMASSGMTRATRIKGGGRKRPPPGHKAPQCGAFPGFRPGGRNRRLWLFWVVGFR